MMVIRLDEPCVPGGVDAEGLVQASAHIMQGDAVLGGISGREAPRGDGLPEALPSRLVTQVVVDSVTERQEANPVADGVQAVTEGVSYSAQMPAQAARALSGQHYPGFPALSQELI